MENIIDILFATDVIILLLLLTGVVWSVAFPERRIWPPPGRGSWQYWLTWICFNLAFALSAILHVLDWDTWVIGRNLRFIIGIPVTIIGALLVSWGIATLGLRNTSGVKDGFVSTGPYAFTRNPQYLGDITLFAGLGLLANSQYLLIAHLLLMIIFAITPLTEEPWLEEQYGEEYIEYKRRTSRFL